ncbi:MAG: hypothetical protein R2764_01940 [Bacteroidales bacterium]
MAFSVFSQSTHTIIDFETPGVIAEWDWTVGEMLTTLLEFVAPNPLAGAVSIPQLLQLNLQQGLRNRGLCVIPTTME